MIHFLYPKPHQRGAPFSLHHQRTHMTWCHIDSSSLVKPLSFSHPLALSLTLSLALSYSSHSVPLTAASHSALVPRMLPALTSQSFPNNGRVNPWCRSSNLRCLVADLPASWASPRRGKQSGGDVDILPHVRSSVLSSDLDFP